MRKMATIDTKMTVDFSLRLRMHLMLWCCLAAWVVPSPTPSGLWLSTRGPPSAASVANSVISCWWGLGGSLSMASVFCREERNGIEMDSVRAVVDRTVHLDGLGRVERSSGFWLCQALQWHHFSSSFLFFFKFRLHHQDLCLPRKQRLFYQTSLRIDTHLCHIGFFIVLKATTIVGSSVATSAPTETGCRDKLVSESGAWSNLEENSEKSAAVKVCGSTFYFRGPLLQLGEINYSASIAFCAAEAKKLCSQLSQHDNPSSLLWYVIKVNQSSVLERRWISFLLPLNLLNQLT